MYRTSSLVLLTLFCINTEADEFDFFDISLEELKDIKVSVASGFEESALDSASSVSVITPRDWNNRGVKRNTKALDMLPGVATFPTWGGSDAIAIRGYTTELSARGIATLIDGVPVNTFSYGTGQYDKVNLGLGTLNRIELIRGPGSTLYGSDAFHGVLSYQTYQSDSDKQAIRSEVDSSNYASISGQFSKQHQQHNLNLALDGRFQGSQDLPYSYTVPGSGTELNSDRRNSYDNFSGSLNYQFGSIEELLIDSGIYLYEMNASGAPGSGTHFFSGNTFQLDRDTSDGDARFQMYRFNLSKRIGSDLDVSLKTSYWKNHHQWSFDNSRFSSFCAPGFTDPATQCALGVPGHTAYQTTSENQYNLAIEAKQNNTALNTQWIASVGHRKSEISKATLERVSLSPTWAGVSSTPAFDDQDREIDYGYFQAKTSFSGGTYQLVYGARYDDYSDVDSHTSPRIGFIYRYNEAWSYKALYGNAFRAPMALEVFGVATVVGNKDIKPETIDTYEFVIQYSSGPWHLETVAFQSIWKDAITLTGDPSLPPGFAVYKNIGRNEAWGIETIANYITDRWIIQSSASYIESTNETSDIDYVAFPKVIANLGVGYTWHEHNISAFLNQRFQFQQFESDYLSISGQPNKPDRIKDYWRTDLNITHRASEDLSVFMNLRNLFGRNNIKPSVYNSEGGIADEDFSAGVGASYAL